ncbi:transposase family protein [Streptomyces sp. NPDC003710]
MAGSARETMMRRLRPVTVLVMQADAASGGSLGFAGIGDVDVEAVTAALGTVNVAARGRAAGMACPDCGRFSGRVHDFYQRRLKDLPLGGQNVVIRLDVRRFICDAVGCPRVRSPSRSLS